jgi:hypothetical protein
LTPAGLWPYIGTNEIRHRPMASLTLLTDSQLESLWCDCEVSADYDTQEAVVKVLLQRPEFCPQSYDLLWELQDQGWNGGCTQADRDAR